jgi:hypothetical protein
MGKKMVIDLNPIPVTRFMDQFSDAQGTVLGRLNPDHRH